MKVKTSITLSEELLRAMAEETDAQNRSSFIETATWEYLYSRKRAAGNRRETDLINENAEELNREARDSLDFQEEQ